MKKTALLPALFLILSAILTSKAEEGVVAENISVDHYQVIWTRSPFGPPSVTADPASSAKWVLTGLLGSADNPMVFIVNKETQEHLSLTKTPNEHGYQVLSFTAENEIFNSSASIRTPEGDILVKYDHDLVTAVNAVNSPAPSPHPNPFGNQQNPFGLPPNFSGNQQNLSLPNNNFGLNGQHGLTPFPNHPIHRIVVPAPPTPPSAPTLPTTTPTPTPPNS